MAKCEEGYLCDVCGEDVADLVESSLYLRYVIGDIHPEVLHVQRERHLRCDPLLAQFIDHPEFPVVVVDGAFGRPQLDAEFVAARVALVTEGWLRLRELSGSSLSLLEYPLPAVLQRFSGSGS